MKKYYGIQWDDGKMSCELYTKRATAIKSAHSAVAYMQRVEFDFPRGFTIISMVVIE